MIESNQQALFLKHLDEAMTADTFLKLTLSNYRGTETGLKNIYFRPVEIKRQTKLSLTYRYKTKDIVKNFSCEEGRALLVQYLTTDFCSATLFSVLADYVLQEKGNSYVFKVLPPSMVPTIDNRSHDKAKVRKISSVGSSYLIDLKLTDPAGNVFKNAQDKYKQINQYIEILSPLIAGMPLGSLKRVADMGSGKGYLTFALYDYLRNNQQFDVQVTGVEFRKDLVELCNQIAVDANFDQLNFVEGSIEAFDAAGTDMLIALHACDTATDDAIYKGIQAGASLIVTAPCCHKQIRRQITKGKPSNQLEFLLQHGIFLERQAEMVTDGLRALILEYYGYQTKVMQFISDQHTPKNVLIVGLRKQINASRQVEILHEIQSIKEFFGITYHYLEKLTGLTV